jgi:Tfp pilus assembly protein PilO
MKASDRAVVFGVLLAALIVGFWLLVLSPKRAEVSRLDDELTDARAALASAEQAATAAEQAKTRYADNYHQLVVLGKAVPAEEDTSSLLVQIQALADHSGIQFDSIELSETGEGSTPPPPATETTADSSSAGTGDSGTDVGDSAAGGDETAAPVSAPATEAAAASLPLGATVGTAGLPVMPYDLHFTGDFFQVADFIKGLDALVQSESPGIGVDGRLMTIDGFALSPDKVRGLPHLVVTLHTTTYVAPAGEGLTPVGSTPTEPATPTDGAPVPTAAETPATTATPTSSTEVQP